MEAPRPSEVIDWPRKVDAGDGRMVPLARVRVRVLNQRDIDEARLRAHVWLKEKRRMKAEDMHTLGVREVLADATAREVLCRAIVMENPIEGTEETGYPRYARIFTQAEQLEDLTPDELVCLFNAYQLTQEKYGPYEGNLVDETEVSAWIERLAKGAALSPLALASSPQLARLSTSLAERAYTLSRILESLLPSLDESLVAALSNLDIGTGFFTEPASTSTSTTSSDSEALMGDVTMDKAVALARRQHQSEEGLLE